MGELWAMVREGGAAGVLAFILWLLIAGKLRLEREYLDMREQRDSAREGEREATAALDEAAGIAERVVKKPHGE